MLKENKVHKHIDTFNPDVEVYNQERQDLLNLFNAGDWFKNFNEFIHKEAMDFCASGEGTTHLVWNVFYDTDGNEGRRELVSYYTLAATSIPYIDRLRKDPEDMGNPEDMYESFNVRPEFLKSRQFYNNTFQTSVNYEELMNLKRKLKK